MSATDKTADFEVGAVAHVNFRLRCENLSHGEEVFLVAESDQGQKKVCQRTAADSYVSWMVEKALSERQEALACTSFDQD